MIQAAWCSDLFICDMTLCPSSQIADGSCDSSCNIFPCDFDSPFLNISNLAASFQSSDCYSQCAATLCNLPSLGNTICDPACNTLDCGWDLGDCGFCSPGCTVDLLTNDLCDPVCANFACMFDNNDCGWCAPGCFEQDLYASTCIPECNTTACQEFGKNPCFLDCSPGCAREMLGDSACDLECNVEECWYDYGDCLCSPGCSPEVLTESTCQGESDPCATKECRFKNGVCGGCALGCTEGMLGNGVCDSECNSYECRYDYMDCGCAPGCRSSYDIVEGWTWDTSGSGDCMVASCFYNYGLGFADPFVAREYILTQIIARNWSLAEIFSHPGCETASLQGYDAGISCPFDDACNDQAGMYCAGMVTSTIASCLRSDGNKCLVCEGVMIMDVCSYSTTDCPGGYVSQFESISCSAKQTFSFV